MEINYKGVFCADLKLIERMEKISQRCIISHLQIMKLCIKQDLKNCIMDYGEKY